VQTNFSHLLSEIFFHDLVPDLAALAILMGAGLKEIKLLSPLPDQGVQPQEFSLKFEDLSCFAFHHEPVSVTKIVS
jgi:hypothetical protein